ncbi:MAG: hypothetical protein J1G07_00620 [Clostridiales bacterium]|nr:hypothetical protein [Clostridiales bacterium]
MISKFNKLFLALAVIIFSISISGCQKFDSFIEGEYVSTDEVDNDIISKIRLELYHIDEQTYLNANGVNVVWDFTKSGADQYFSFNLYLYVDELGEYCKMDLTDFKHSSHSPTYYCYPTDKDASYNINAITFWFTIGPYDPFFMILLHQNGMEYYYQISLINNSGNELYEV